MLHRSNLFVESISNLHLGSGGATYPSHKNGYQNQLKNISFISTNMYPLSQDVSSNPIDLCKPGLRQHLKN
jgi:hypothetical protein